MGQSFYCDMEQGMSIHPNGLFEYEKRIISRVGWVMYTKCRLLKDLVYDTIANPQSQLVTFHDDALCRQGALFDTIHEEVAGSHLYGWDNANQDSLVLDVVYK